MTPKEALAVLHRGMSEAFSSALHTDPTRDEERWQLYRDLLEAIGVLIPLVHGAVPFTCLRMLCKQCHMQCIPWTHDEAVRHGLCADCVTQRQQAALQQEAAP